ncbi:MAG TPA: outer membrane protein transport protein [Kofleriaceae bacterium]|nr:outer membrane protein transport protein [Kofleriaceae bacterium]
MKLALGVTGCLVVVVPSVHAGGLFLPGSGAISTSRAGAAVASTDDGEALSINPAGLAKTHGTTITVAASLISYSMEFSRQGAYDSVVAEDTLGFEGQAFPTIENKAKPPLGIGSFQPIPVIAIVSDLGGRVEGLHVAAGLYAPSGYPFRDMTNGYEFNVSTSEPPPPTRYDVLTAESQLIFPSLAASYRVLAELDVGARFSAGRAKSKTSVAIWGTPNNVDESVRQDTLFTADVADGFVPTFGVGATYRPTPAIEIGAVYNSSATLRTKGTAQSVKGLGVDPDRVVGPIPDEMSRCETGGDFDKQKACITVQLPQNATVGARYKVLDSIGRMKADVELNLGWENWGKTCDFTSTGQMKDPDCASPSQILVKLDTGLWTADRSTFAQPVEVNFVNLGLRDTYSVRLGGSYHIVLDEGFADPQPEPTKIIVRGGIGYDTKAAREGWLRASFDGAARITSTLGAAYHARTWEVNVGGGFVYEGAQTNAGDCNPTRFDPVACSADGSLTPLDQRTGPDPTNPLVVPEFQTENPYNQGTIRSHYLLFMLGYSKWF